MRRRFLLTLMLMKIQILIKFKMNTIVHVCHLGFLLPAIRNFTKLLQGSLDLLASLLLQVFKVGNLSIIKDVPLNFLRKLVGDIRKKEYTKERWQSWYNRTNSGKLVRQASTAACILNEMIFGLSDQALDDLKTKFHNNISSWNVSVEKDLKSQLIDCIGSILHEYLSPEIWNLPLDRPNVEAGDVTVHYCYDNAMLHQEITIYFIFSIIHSYYKRH